MRGIPVQDRLSSAIRAGSGGRALAAPDPTFIRDAKGWPRRHAAR
jgi:hypothetical protein